MDPLSPDRGRDKLLWMMIEAGEVAYVIKKMGDKMIMDDIDIRNNFIEEMCDTLMYFNDVVLCYDISPQELEQINLQKHQANMKGW